MNDRSAANLRRNHAGNVDDEHGGSYYVVADSRSGSCDEGEESTEADEDDEKIAGPFGSAPYAATVRDRMDETWPTDVRVEYET